MLKTKTMKLQISRRKKEVKHFVRGLTMSKKERKEEKQKARGTWRAPKTKAKRGFRTDAEGMRKANRAEKQMLAYNRKIRRRRARGKIVWNKKEKQWVEREA